MALAFLGGLGSSFLKGIGTSLLSKAASSVFGWVGNLFKKKAPPVRPQVPG